MNPKEVVFGLFMVLFLLASSSLVIAAEEPDLIIVNSNNWVDVYNSLLYGSLTNTPVLFLSDQSQTNLFFNSIDYSVEDVLLVESDSRLSPTASKILDSLGYSVNLVTDDDTSSYFADLLDVNSYILVDINFPSNALSVAPYAAASNSWVFFVDNSIPSFVASKISGANVMTYGRVPLQLLQESTPSVVIDKGNKYRNSVEMAKLFLEEFPTTQFVLTQGSFLESELFIPTFPVLIVGVSSTPKPIEDFFIDSSVSSAVVVGQASIPASINLKRFLESTHDKSLKLVAKLGQTSSDPQDENEIVPLNTFPIPSPSISVNLDSFFYNQITQQIEARFSNDGDVFVSYVPSIIITKNGETIVLEAEDEEYVLEKSESRTVQFPIDLNIFDDISAEVTVVYGESVDSFEFSTSYDFAPLEFISIVDDSNMFVEEITYDSKNKVFLIDVFNNGTVPAYADVDLIDVIVGGVPESFSSPRAILIEPQDSTTLVIYAVMSDVDILANPTLNFELVYGQRNFALIKSHEGTLPLKQPSFLANITDNPGLVVIAVSVVVFGMLFFFLLRRRSKDKN